MIKIHIKNAAEIKRKFQRYPVRMEREIGMAVKKSAFEIEREAKPVTPVDTGRLQASIIVDSLTKTRAVISPHTDYALTVHEGLGHGRNSRPRRFMKQGAEKATDKINKHFKQAIDNALR